MTKIDKAGIAKLGQLSRIGLSKQEAAHIPAEITAILGYVEKLQAVDVSGLKPTSQVTGLVDVWRADKPYSQSWDTAELLKNAPATEDGYIKVKRVIE